MSGGKVETPRSLEEDPKFNNMLQALLMAQ
jgi:hypothetical protein